MMPKEIRAEVVRVLAERTRDSMGTGSADSGGFALGISRFISGLAYLRQQPIQQISNGQPFLSAVVALAKRDRV